MRSIVRDQTNKFATFTKNAPGNDEYNEKDEVLSIAEVFEIVVQNRANTRRFVAVRAVGLLGFSGTY